MLNAKTLFASLGDPSRLAVRKAQYHYVRLAKPIFSNVLITSGVGLGTYSSDVRTMETNKPRSLFIPHRRSLLYYRSRKVARCS